MLKMNEDELINHWKHKDVCKICYNMGRADCLKEVNKKIDELWQISIKNYDELGEDRSLLWGFGKLKEILEGKKK